MGRSSHQLGDGDGLGEGEGDGDGELDGEDDGELDGDGDGDGEAFWVTPGIGSDGGCPEGSSGAGGVASEIRAMTTTTDAPAAVDIATVPAALAGHAPVLCADRR